MAIPNGTTIDLQFGMQPKVINKQKPLDVIPEKLPCISFIVPFEPRMNTRKGLNAVMSAAAQKEEKHLAKIYPEDQAKSVIAKLRELVNRLDYKKRNKSIGVFVSPLAAKIYYFNYSEGELKNHR